MTPMQYTTLGRTGIATSTLVLGCARLGSALTPLTHRESLELIADAFALGVRHFDTASVYGQGDSERLLGEALGTHRHEVCLATKAGQRLTPAQAAIARFKTPIRWLAARRSSVRTTVAEQRARGVPRCFEPDYIEDSLHESLQRLRTDYVDIFYLHSPDAAVLSDARLMARIEQLRQQGLFRAFGISCDDDTAASAALVHQGVQAVQFASDDGPRTRGYARELQRRGKFGVVRGLAQKAVSATAVSPASPADALRERFERTLALPALGGVIVGTTNRAHLRENVEAFHRAIMSAEIAA